MESNQNSLATFRHYMSVLRGCCDESVIADKLVSINVQRVKAAAVVILLITPFLFVIDLLNHSQQQAFSFIEFFMVAFGCGSIHLSKHLQEEKKPSSYRLKLFYRGFWLAFIIFISVLFISDVKNTFLLPLFMYIVIVSVPILTVYEMFFFVTLMNCVILLPERLGYISGSHSMQTMLLTTIFALGLSLVRYDINYRHIKNEQELIKANQQLAKMSITDSLTGLLNRWGLSQITNELWQQGEVVAKEVSLVIIDIDDFKGYNDSQGHYQGDDCLSQVAEVIQEAFKESAKAVARIGGDEFIVLLCDVSDNDATDSVRKMQSNIATLLYQPNLKKEPVQLTVSAGVALSRPVSHTSWVELYQEADAALYAAKEHSGNHVVFFETQTVC